MLVLYVCGKCYAKWKAWGALEVYSGIEYAIVSGKRIIHYVD